MRYNFEVFSIYFFLQISRKLHEDFMKDSFPNLRRTNYKTRADIKKSVTYEKKRCH